MYYVGTLYFYGEAVEPDYNTAVKWFRRAIAAGLDSDGDSEGIRCSGCLSELGWGVDKDPKEALKRFEKAADLDNTNAMIHIGTLYIDPLTLWRLGPGGLPDNNPKAMYWFRRAAEMGDADSMSIIGALYADRVIVNDASGLNSMGVHPNYYEAMKWYKKAADLGQAAAMEDIGTLYYNGFGVTQDYPEAMKWFRKAADVGNANANGEAFIWWQRSEFYGGLDAMFNIGAMYTRGEGVPQDYIEAMKWYRMAADLGFPPAMLAIGIDYESGIGVSADADTAIAWYRKKAGTYGTSGQRLALLVQVAVLDPALSSRYSSAKGRGVLITNWYKNSTDSDREKFRTAGLHIGDVVLRVGHVDVHSAVEFYRGIAETRADSYVAFTVCSDDGTERSVRF